MGSTANFSDQMTPAVVVIAAVSWTRASSGGLTVSEAFTSLSVVALVAAPVANLIGSYPMFVSSLACFGRIQKFLNSDEQKDERISEESFSIERKALTSECEMTNRAPGGLSNLEMQDLTSNGVSSSARNPVVELQNASFTISGKTEAVIR